ncbi:LacI family DNA-binding transcriptional regulator, partial [Georgenia sp. Z1344]|uniref:LacI family DNA-binding transcriptional regulator n=1 Tax=Georgenia sp. Z1344 TaxID=3416706 RepID=UPI003CE80F29
KMVAAQAGVGPASVSRVFSGHPDVSEDMRESVLKAASEVGYEVDLVARALRSGESRTIGILIGNILNPFLAEIVAGASEHLRSKGYAVLLADAAGDREDGSDVEAIRVLLQRRVDGLILSLTDETSAGLRELLERSAVPQVLLDRSLDFADVDAVISDHRGGMKKIVDHLHGLGHRRIGLIIGSYSTRPSRERRAGFIDAMTEFGLAVDEELILSAALSEPFGYEAMSQLLNHPEPPTAIICGGNQITAGALRLTHDRQVEIPSDVSVVACDDIPITQLHQPSITVLARDAMEMGRTAATALLCRLQDDGTPPQEINVPTTIVVRGSTAPVE